MSCLPGMDCWQNTPDPGCGTDPCLVFKTPCDCIPLNINSTNVIYSGSNLTNINVHTNDNLTLILSEINDAITSISSISLTTLGNEGPSTLMSGVLNIPNYTLAGLGGLPLVDGIFQSNITVSLSGTKTLGKYTNGQTIPSAGLTAEQVLNLIAIEYINPVFNSFSISGQSTTIEVGTTLSGSKTFIWSISPNSGVVPTIDIYDNTAASTLLAGTPNDGTQAVTINTIQLNSTGAAQSWKGIGNNTSPSGTLNSSNFVVTSLFYRFYGPSAASVTNSAQVRALPVQEFHPGVSTFILNTGSSLTKFIVALPPTVTISTVFDLDALSANITSSYVLTGTVNVLDAGSTNRAYNIYEMNIGLPYSSNHRHSITTSN